MEQLQADIELLELTPEQIRERLEEIHDQFATYLKQHPDESLQMELRIKGATEDEIRAPLERWQQAFRDTEQLGLYEGTGGLSRKRSALDTGLALAFVAGDRAPAFEIIEQIRQVDEAMRAADFEGKMDRISQAREQALTGAAEELARVEAELNRVKQELCDQDTEAHRIATEAKIAEQDASLKMAEALQGLRQLLRDVVGLAFGGYKRGSFIRLF